MICLAFMFFMNGKSQEYLSGFNGGVPKENIDAARDEAVATLPFFDDFTNPGIYPDAAKWQSKNVFVNSGFPKMPVNHGAATFDVADRFGVIYANGSSNPFIADSLLSVRIRLDSVGSHALSLADSLYFSFYYQPGGYGDSPERDDSLVLKFGYNDNDSIIWRHIWATEGQSLESFVDSLGTNRYFKKVMIPITDSCFFTNEFYLLFYNYGTLPNTMYPNDRSNMDQWNVDFVRLDMNRRFDDDSYPLVGFTNTAPTFLKRYSSMPYKHFKDNPVNEIDNVFDMYFTNLDANTHQVRYSVDINDNNSEWSYSYTANPLVINRYDEIGALKDSIAMETFIYPYNLSVDTTSFTIRHYLDVVDDSGMSVAGDSLVHRQGFYNYFAYDDGTPEMGYGLVPGDTYFASQFKVTKLDTVSGVLMLFNRTFNDANYNFFDIVIWKDNNGKPGEILYTLKDQRPIWNDSVMYQFSYYPLNEKVKVNSTFYVGIRQQYSKTINIGFDASADNSRYNFYDAGDGWKNSTFRGSLMIRPIMGKTPYIIGIDENQEVASNLNVYPNPACNMVHVEGIDWEMCNSVVVMDMTGRVIKQHKGCNELNVSDLHNGVYMLRAIMSDGSYKTSKLLISK